MLRCRRAVVSRVLHADADAAVGAAREPARELPLGEVAADAVRRRAERRRRRRASTCLLLATAVEPRQHPCEEVLRGAEGVVAGAGVAADARVVVLPELLHERRVALARLAEALPVLPPHAFEQLHAHVV